MTGQQLIDEIKKHDPELKAGIMIQAPTKETLNKSSLNQPVLNIDTVRKANGTIVLSTTVVS